MSPSRFRAGMTIGSPLADSEQRERRVDQLRLVRDVGVARGRRVHLLLEHPLVDRADRVLRAAEDLRAGALRLAERELGDSAADSALDALGAEARPRRRPRPRATPARRTRRRPPSARPRSARGRRRTATTPGIRRPVRTITWPPISSRRIRFGEPTSSAPSGVIVAAFSPSPASRTAAAASWTTAFCVARRCSSERSKRGSSSSMPMTSGARTRSASSSSSCPVSSPSSTTIVLRSTAADCTRRSDAVNYRRRISRCLSIESSRCQSLNERRISMARKTVLVCDKCGAEVERKGRDDAHHLHGCRRGSRQADLCDSCAGKQPGSHGRPPRPKPKAKVGRVGVRAPSGWVRRHARRSRLGGVPLTLLAGPANAGKVALLLDRYAADIAREPVSSSEPGGGRARRAGSAAPAARPSSAAGSGRSTTSSRASPTGTAITARCSRTPSARSCCGVSRRDASRASRASPTRSAPRSRSSRPGSSSPTMSTATSRSSARLPRRARPARRWDRDVERRYAADRVAGELDAWDGRPVYAYGFEDLTAAQWALVEALAGRADVTVSLPVRARAARVRVAERTAATCPRWRADRGASAAPSATSGRRSRTSSEGCSSDGRRPLRPLEGAVRFLEAAGARGGAGAGRRRDPRRCSAAARPAEIAVVAPSLERRAGRSRRPSPSSGSRTRSRARMRSAIRRSAARWSRCSASPGSAAGAATCSRSCARPTPGSRATTPTSSKDGCAGARSARRSASRRRRSGCAASPAVPRALRAGSSNRRP